MSHHHCQCDHSSVRYCRVCHVVHCLDCNQEWTARSAWSPYYNTYTIRGLTGGATGTVSAGGENTMKLTSTCSHGG